MRDASQHEEFSVAAYLRDVLQLEEGDTEDAVAKDLAIEAAELGVQIAQPQKEPLPVRDSGLTAETEHVRTSSTGSRASVSTGLTVPASFEEVASSRRFSQRSLSFSEYDKYLAHTETSCSFEPVTLKPAPSIFSVSGHRSYAGIKAGIKNRFKLHRRRIPPKTLSGEEELERRRAEEEERAKLQAEEDAAKEAELARTEAALTAALKRSEDSAELTSLRQMQIGERERFIDFDKKAKWTMWTRHGQAKLDILDKYSELQSKMMDRHAKTSSHLEDRQVEAEMDLRASLKQSERSVQIRLRHMEAYCHGRGRDVAFQGSRDVTERDLRELEQQYNLRNNLQRMQEAKINVLREQQAKQMDQLLTRQNEEMEKLGMKRDEDLVALEEEFELEEEKSHALSAARKERLRLRWSTQHEIGRQKLIRATGLEFARLKDVDFDSPVQCTDGLDTVQE
ncbi:MAG: hypothetical protein M1818_002787 [Claussenomyces sp. TS43310]|nr:MAG: hypothetical protein M1818_002787 [Claussenomyces sp. TS43310]